VSVAPAAASGGSSSILQKGLSSSKKLQRLVDAAGSLKPSRLDGVDMSTVRRVGKLEDRFRRVDIDTTRLTRRLDGMPGARRHQVTKQFDELDGKTKDYFDRVDSGSRDPELEATRLFENTGPSGRRALNDLAESDQDAADVLLQMDDAATQRRFTRAYDSSMGQLSRPDIGRRPGRPQSISRTHPSASARRIGIIQMKLYSEPSE